MTVEQVQLTEDQWLNVFKYFRGLPGQRAGLLKLRKHIIQADPTLLVDGADWLTDYRRSEGLPKSPAPPQAPPAAFAPSSPFTLQITPHVAYGEFALYQEARRFVASHQCATARLIAEFLEKVRAEFGAPIEITSGYRPPAINSAVGGASQSEHLYDAPDTGAVDFLVTGKSIYAVQDWCDKNWPYSLGYGAPKGFVHLGVRPGRPRVRWDY